MKPEEKILFFKSLACLHISEPAKMSFPKYPDDSCSAIIVIRTVSNQKNLRSFCFTRSSTPSGIFWKIATPGYFSLTVIL